jgi:hypothetical protein
MRQLFEAAANLDLKSVKGRFLRMRLGGDVDQMERQYRQFLVAVGTTKCPFALPESLDDFWHAHILDTRKYNDDCRHLYGTFLHHDISTHNATPSVIASTSVLLERLFGPGDHWGLKEPTARFALCIPTIDAEPVLC